MIEIGYLDVKGAAAFLACPISRIYNMTFRRAIPFFKLGSSVRFKPDDLRAFMEKGRIEAQADAVK